MSHDINLAALVKGAERYVFLYDEPGNPMLVVGTASGDVLKIDLASGATVDSINLDSTAIGHIDLVDLDNSGTDEILATHESGSSKPTYALRANGLSTIWQTDRPTGCSTGTEVMGGKVWSGDLDRDGVIELVIPTTSGYDNLLQVFSAETGQQESSIVQDGYNYLPSVYYNRADGSYHLFASRNPGNDPWDNYARAYDLTNGNALEWENTSVNTWKRGAISESMIDGLPRLWGGWYGRTLYVMNASGNALWSKSFGGGYEAEGSYGGDLRGDGVETILIAGTTGGAPQVDAANLATGATLWTFTDPEMYWSASVLGAEDANGDGVKEVFVGGGSPRSRFQVLDGADGQPIWSQDVPSGDLMNFTQLIDVDADGQREVLLAFGNTVQARDAMTGSLVRTYTFNSNVTAFASSTRLANRAPVAIDDAHSVDEDGTLSVAAPGVLGNDWDPDGDPLEARRDPASPIIEIAQGPFHGEVSLRLDGSFDYTPDPDYSGDDWFTYRAHDAELPSNEATVHITVTPVNDPPVLGEIRVVPETILEGELTSLEGSFSDPDAGDAHTVIIVWGDGSQPEVLHLAPGTLAFAATHQYLDDNPTGTSYDDYVIQVTVQDDDGGSSDTSGQDFRDDFEDNQISTADWVYGGERRGWYGDPLGGAWEWSHTETVYRPGDPDGYLQVRAWGPPSGLTYGADAWIQTAYDFKDTESHLINFAWQPEYLTNHANFYSVQITDGTFPPQSSAPTDTYFFLVDYPGIKSLLQTPWLGSVAQGLMLDETSTIAPPGPPEKWNWSIVIDPSGVARMYDQPDGAGTLLGERSLEGLDHWYFRLFLWEGTSGGFPGGDIRLNLYSFEAGAPGSRPGTVTVRVNNAPPTVVLGPDAMIEEGTTFVGACSFTDPGADTWMATVDYGDGSGVQPLALNADKTFPLSHTYTQGGVYTVTVNCMQCKHLPYLVPNQAIPLG